MVDNKKTEQLEACLQIAMDQLTCEKMPAAPLPVGESI
jgi:hypothetical protein